MTAPLWVVELAARFWAEADEPEPFPRQLREPILWTSFDLTVEELPGLTTRTIERYLASLGCPRRYAAQNRPLRGCLVADNGCGWIFLDANDERAERTASLAHELAHFLRDYWLPRERAVGALGPQILAVLDGRRPPCPAERLHAVLRDVPIGRHIHLMERHPDFVEPAVRAAEEAADRLALELLAPAEEVVRRRDGATDRTGVARILTQDFGLPLSLAATYAAILVPARALSPLLERLRNAHNSCRTSASGREKETGGSRDEQSA